MANSERIAQNILRTASVLLTGGLAMTWLGGDARAAILDPHAAAYVDCAKQPGASTSVQFDAFRRQEFFLGDVQTGADGGPEKWRTVFDIDTRQALGELGVAVNGFGPIVEYSDLPKTGTAAAEEPLISSYNGERFTMVQAPHPEVSSHAPVLVTFTCGPA